MGDREVRHAVLAILLVVLLVLSSAPPVSAAAKGTTSGSTLGAGSRDASSPARTTSPQGCTYPSGWLPPCPGTQGVGMPTISAASPWQPVSSPHGPPDSNTGLGTMAYDAADGYLVLVTWNWTNGADETWTFSGGTWTKLAIASPPVSGLSTPSPSMVFDPEAPGTSCFVGTSGCLILLLGTNGSSESEWQYAAGAWTDVSSSVSLMHGPWSSLGLIYDPNGSDCLTLSPCLLATSGVPTNTSWECNIPCQEVETFQTTWEYMPSFRTWEDISVAVGPNTGRAQVLGSQQLFYDPVLGHAILVSPDICLPPPQVSTVGPVNCGGTEYAVYEMTPSGWYMLPWGCPPSTGFCTSQLLGLQDSSYAFDAANRFLVQFGGAYSNTAAENTTYAFYGDQVEPTGSAWLDVSSLAGLGTGPEPQPSQRVLPLMSYDPNPSDCGAPTPPHGCVILFGGADCPGGLGYCFVDDLADTWRFWLPVTPEIYTDPAKVLESHTLYLNVTVIGGTGRYVWYNRSWLNNVDPGCPANSIYDDLHSRVSCVVSLPTGCSGPHSNLFNVSVAVTDTSGEVGTSGAAEVEVDPYPLISHFYDRYPVVYPGIDLGQTFPPSLGLLTDNYGIAIWGRSWTYSGPSTWHAVNVQAYLEDEGGQLSVQSTTWDNVQVYYVSLSTTQQALLPLTEQIIFNVQMGPSGTACATVTQDLGLNATYGKHNLPYTPVGLNGQYGAVGPGAMLTALLSEIPSLVSGGTVSAVLTTWGDQGGHGLVRTFNATWYANFTLTLDLKSVAKASLPDPVSGAAEVLPKVAVTLSISSVGKVALTASSTWSVPLGKLAGISFTFSLVLSAQAKFIIEESNTGGVATGSLVLTNFSVALTVNVAASVTFPIYGISLGPLGTIGLTMTIKFSIGVGLSLWFEPTSDPTQYFLGWIPVLIQKVEALIAIALSVSVGLNLGIASINFGGTLEMDIYLQSVGPLLRGMDLLAAVFVQVSALFWSWQDNLWQGVLWSEGNPTPGIADGAPPTNASFVQGSRYYNVTGYQSVVWASGSASGPLMNDLYPTGGWDLAPTPTGSYLLYGTDNVSVPRDLGLTLGMLEIGGPSSTPRASAVPSLPQEIAFDPRLASLPDGSLLGLWDAVPDSAAVTATGPQQLSGMQLQYARFDTNSGQWGPVSTLVGSGYPVSYLAGSCGGSDERVVYLDASSLLAHGGVLKELSLATGGLLASVNAPGAATVRSFDCAGGLVVLEEYGGGTSVVNLTSGLLWNIPTVGGYYVGSVTGVTGGTSDLAVLYRNDSASILQLVSPSGAVLANVSLPENVSAVSVIASGSSFVIATSCADGPSVYLLDAGTLLPVQSLLWKGLITSRLSLSPSGVATLIGEVQGGNGAYPWENLSMAIFSLTAVPSLFATPSVTDVGVPVAFHANATTVEAPLSYAWTGLPPGCSSQDQPTIACTPTSPGSYPVEVRVTDAKGFTATSPQLNFLVAPSLVLGPVQAAPATLEVGDRLALAVTPPSGSSGVHYVWNGLPPGCVSEDEASFACFPSSPGNYAIGVTVTDASGASASSNSTVVSVAPGLALLTLLPSADPVAAGGSVTIAGTVSGGVGPLSYAWTGLPPGCGASTGATVTCSVPSPGTYLVGLTVTDSEGAVAFGGAQVTVIAAPSEAPSPPFDLFLLGLGALAVATVVVWWWPPPPRARSED